MADWYLAYQPNQCGTELDAQQLSVCLAFCREAGTSEKYSQKFTLIISHSSLFIQVNLKQLLNEIYSEFFLNAGTPYYKQGIKCFAVGRC